MASVSSLHRYPVKSCRGSSLESARVERRGFALDRRFMVVDEGGAFRSQRADPELARVDVLVRDDRVRLSRDGADPISIPLATVEAGPALPTSVRTWSGTSVDQGDEAAAWFSSLLGSPSRLVYMPDDVHRPIGAKRLVADGDEISFVDAAPLLLTCTTSLAELQAHMDEPVPMDRFRANLVVEGTEPWEEDDWREIRIGTAAFAVVSDCTRCVITTTDQLDGTRHREPLRTLGQRRRTDDGVRFGRYLVPTVLGEVHVGDIVTVVR